METTTSKGKEIRIPGPDHPITISLVEGRVRVTVAGRTAKRPAVTEVVAWVAGSGDRSENADYWKDRV